MSETQPAIGVIVVTHGQLGQELVEAAGVILGRQGELPLRALSIGWNDPMEEAREQVREALEQTELGSGVLILTDMFGGTPSNLAISVLDKGKVEVIAGVNLPMLIKLASVRSKETLRKAVNQAQEYRDGLLIEKVVPYQP